MTNEEILKELEFFVPQVIQLAATDITSDYSKYFVIFAYNYNELGMEEETNEMLKYVKDSYITRELVNDMKYAIECRDRVLAANKLELISDKEDMEEMEFFVCAAGIIPLLRDRPTFNELLRQLLLIDFGAHIDHNSGVLQ